MPRLLDSPAYPPTPVSPSGRWRGFSAPSSARVRILGWYVLLLALALGTALLATRVVLRADVNQRIDTELRLEAAEAQTIATSGFDPKTGEPFTTIEQLLAAHLAVSTIEPDAALITLLDGVVNGHVDPSSGAHPDQDQDLVRRWGAVTALTYGQVSSAVGEVRYVAVPAGLGSGPPRAVLVYAVLPASAYAAVNRVIGIGAATSGAALVLVSLIAWLVAGRVLRPVRQVTAAANSIITDTDLRERLPVRGHDELSALAGTFNRMLDRLAAAFTAQRGFIADAGHELRTPITVIRGHLELLERTDADADRARIVTVLQDELDRMNRLVNDLLMLSRAERPDFVALDLVDLTELTHGIHAKVSTLADRRWVLDGIGTGPVVVDRDRLSQAVLELASNADTHSPPGAPIHLGSHRQDGEVRLWVADEGPGVPASDRERIFHRFARGTTHRPGDRGSGLGLAIVTAITAAHDGRVELTDNPTGIGAVFTLIFPSQPNLPAEEADEFA